MNKLRKRITSLKLNNYLIHILGIPALILLILWLLQFNWDETDFIVMGILLVGGVGLIKLAMKATGKYRIYAILAIVLGVLWLYAELAVGIFTNWGS